MTLAVVFISPNAGAVLFRGYGFSQSNCKDVFLVTLCERLTLKRPRSHEPQFFFWGGGGGEGLVVNLYFDFKFDIILQFLILCRCRTITVS